MRRASSLNADDLELLEAAARTAGELAMSFFGQDPRRWFKDNNSPVSEADMAVDRHLAEVLRNARPGYGWLSEETVDSPERLSCERTFIVDPIDGTRAFLLGGDEWTVSLAVAEAGRPVAAALLCPVRGEMFLATTGGGATLNGEVMKVSGHEKLAGSRLAAPHSVTANAGVRAMGFQSGPGIRSLAYRIALVAANRLEVAAARAYANDWDLAAADLLVQEAGGRLTDLDGQAVSYNRSSTRHPALIAAPLQLVPAVCGALKGVVS
ncbi:3'(2'),5'-bisphosphate nucleotidase CysQ [Roseibium litorale]|uniref:3'(2'),5'-bisphosphate nucleotidase CysQ n=1 Tax=Roseibium litorale TaxID=2803841 RepID=A0ABR9CQ45_9HYPH|nr:3'(2'),5'-bisphosphate nucleotidase CysQ [Roseibium litorale]MBD8892986.1 3'(2'),5'-bisphosphate nucleotidase CysQ [Roseibium litorale]